MDTTNSCLREDVLECIEEFYRVLELSLQMLCLVVFQDTKNSKYISMKIKFPLGNYGKEISSKI